LPVDPGSVNERGQEMDAGKRDRRGEGVGKRRRQNSDTPGRARRCKGKNAHGGGGLSLFSVHGGGGETQTIASVWVEKDKRGWRRTINGGKKVKGGVKQTTQDRGEKGGSGGSCPKLVLPGFSQ